MREHDRFRDAARVRVDAPVDRVRELLSDPAVLSEVDDRLAGTGLEILREEGRVEVWDEGERVHLAFRLRPEDDATTVAALEDVEPQGFVEQTKRWLFPGQAHEDLEEELDRFRVLAEALDLERQPAAGEA
jgi:hypothetical protein